LFSRKALFGILASIDAGSRGAIPGDFE